MKQSWELGSYCSLTNRWSSPAQIALKWTFWGLGWEWSFEQLFRAAVLQLSFLSCFQRMMRKADGGGRRPFFWREKRRLASLKNGEEKKEGKWNNNSKPGYYFNCRNRLIVAELATSPFPVFLLSSGNREERFMSWNRCWWGSAPGLSGAPGSLPQTQPGEGEPTMPLPSSLWIIDLIYINYRRFSGSVGRCVGWGVVGVEFQERRIWEGKWFNQHQFS